MYPVCMVTCIKYHISCNPAYGVTTLKTTLHCVPALSFHASLVPHAGQDFAVSCLGLLALKFYMGQVKIKPTETEVTIA